jgi:hypothetical protein
MRPSITENISDYPGKIRITCNNIEIFTNEVLNLPVGMMFSALDENTKKPKICTMTFGGVFIEEFESTTTPELLHAMILKQEEFAMNQAELMMKMDEERKRVNEREEKDIDERNRDVI